jgi:hypothetical protein
MRRTHRVLASVDSANAQRPEYFQLKFSMDTCFGICDTIVSANAQRPDMFIQVFTRRFKISHSNRNHSFHTSRLTTHVSCFMSHAHTLTRSHVLTPHVSRLTSHVSRLTSHVSRLTFSRFFPRKPPVQRRTRKNQ